MNRIELLHNHIVETPEDPFGFYALALEYKKAGNNESALQFFQKVHHNWPDYLANYFHYAGFLEELDRINVAKDIYQEGIELAKNQDNQKTLAELKNALYNLELEL